MKKSIKKVIEIERFHLKINQSEKQKSALNTELEAAKQDKSNSARIRELEAQISQKNRQIFYIDGGRGSLEFKDDLQKIIHRKIDFFVAGTNEKGEQIFQRINRKIKWQIEAEAYALLTMVFYLIEKNIKKSIIKHDNIHCVFGGIKKGVTKAKDYLLKAGTLAKKNKLDIKFEWISGKKNIAHKYANPIKKWYPNDENYINYHKKRIKYHKERINQLEAKLKPKKANEK